MSNPIANKSDHASRVPFRTKAAWGSGGLADNFLGWTIAYLALPIYNIGMGVNPILIGAILSVPRLLDAFLDPVVGNLSDNTRSRWGRRRPWILGAGIVAAFFYTLAWMPLLGVSVNLVAAYFMITTVLYMCAYSFFTIPYSALGVELTEDYHERTSIMSSRQFFSAIGAIIMPWMMRASVWAGELWGPAGHPHPEVYGIRWIGGTVGLLIVICVILPVIACREKTSVQSQEKIGLRQALLLTMKNRAFLLNAGTLFTAIVGFMMINPIWYYLGFYYVFGGDIKPATELAGIIGMIYGIMGICILPLVNILSRRFGKKAVLIGGQALTLVGALSSCFMITPAHPYWGLITAILIASGQPAIWVLTGSIGAEICDLDELDTGMRREGMYGAVTALIFKCGVGLSSLLSGVLLALAGFSSDVANSPSGLPGDVILRMRLFYIVVLACFVITGIILTSLLPVTEKRMREVREILNSRRRDRELEEAQRVESPLNS